eukprot:gnl/TRDRNA2_/TRDRNA2_134467_c0_seq2.p1 gnl/TRDRNA2_/TRDRNA2_134467_c0~~gnl/TRDRNA2_/TRDRNA2_134467_c0_seq2.p1  ORF type:complete len:298 (+),score=56.08 gnl/TRDRNA2_/TRDRNA2_134467_c0_seq2:71-964(+)
MSLMALGDCLAHVGSFCTEGDLAAAEQAPVFERRVAKRLLHELADAAARDVVPWDFRAQAGLAGKSLLHEVKRLRKHFLPLSRWSPVIDVPTMGSIRARPSKSLEAPVVHVPVAFGIQLGQPLTLGIRLHCAAGRIQEGCCVGVVVAGALDGLDSSHKIYFAPSTGRCFHEYPGGEAVMVARVMPPLALDHSKEDVEAWVEVLPNGGVCFLRRRQGNLEASGVLPRATLPACASEYFAAVLFKPRELETPTRLSIVHSGAVLPEGMSSADAHTEFSAVWQECGEAEVDAEHEDDGRR